MKIQCFILGLFVFATVAHCESETEGPDRRPLNRRLNRLVDLESQIDNGNGDRRRHHFTHNAAWHRRHGIPMPDKIKANLSNNESELANSDGALTNRFNSDELGNRSNNSGKRCEKC